MKVLAQIKSIGEPRIGTSSTGNAYAAHPVVASTEMGYIGFEVYFSKDGMQRRGFVVDAYGTIDISSQAHTYVDKNGVQRITTNINVDARSWDLVNQHVNRPQSVTDNIAAAVHDVRVEATASPKTIDQEQEEENSKLPF